MLGDRPTLRRLRPLRAAALAMAALALTASAAGASPGPAPDWAGAALGPDAAVPQAGGTVTAEDLLALRELGGLSVSPDGRRVAFSLRAAAMGRDDYVVRWFVVDADGARAPRALPFDGGQPIRALSMGLPYGWFPDEHAAWSPDGRTIAVRRRVGQAIQLWTIDVDTGAAAPVFEGPAQVVAFAWAGRALIFRTGFDPERGRRLSALEAEHGWRLEGARLGPVFAARTPSPVQPDCAAGEENPACDDRTLAWDGEGPVRAATAPEAAALQASLRPAAGLTSPEARRLSAGPSATMAVGRQDVGVVSSSAPDGRRAWTTVVDPSRREAIFPLRRVMAGQTACPAAACTGMFIQEIGFLAGGRKVWFLKRESLEGDEAGGPFDAWAIYVWTPASGRVVRALKTSERLDGCGAAGERLICEASAPTQPGRIVAIDLARAAVRILADPNPAMSQKDYPRVRRLVLTDPDGNKGYAHLVYPNGFTPGRRYPLVVVLYRSAGFLRADQPGDETPIYPLAARGYVVLSVDIPQDWAAERTLDQDHIVRKQRVGDHQHRMILAAVRRTLKGLEAAGIADPSREAIAGLSYGAELVHAALRDGEPYAAAIASQTAADISYVTELPPGRFRETMSFALGASVPPAPGSYLAETAWSQHPDRLRSPLLLNLSQNEAWAGFEGVSTLQAAGRPLEVRIFPDEGHIKYHPRNRAGVYENNLMWLDFWLMGREDPDPRFADQYIRWRAMRARLGRAPDRGPG